jgi:hypothetical protein
VKREHTDPIYLGFCPYRKGGRELEIVFAWCNQIAHTDYKFWKMSFIATPPPRSGDGEGMSPPPKEKGAFYHLPISHTHRHPINVEVII